MANQERPQPLEIDPAATREITGIIKLKRLTNDKYDELTPKADKMIEKNNREYAAMYRRLGM